MRTLYAIVALLVLHLVSPTAAIANHEEGHLCPVLVCPGLGNGHISVGSVEDTPGGKIAYTTPDPVAEWRLVNTCLTEDVELGGCTEQPPCPAPPDRTVSLFLVQYRVIADGPGPWISDGIHCVDITELEPVVTPAMVLAEFMLLPLPEGEVTFQPSGGQVLIHMGAIFFTTQDETASYDVVILDQAVRIDAYITDYAWHLGDGSPDLHGRGAPWPDKENLHVYTATGPVQVSLTLTWAATYSVDGGPVEDVPGTTTTDSPVSTLNVVSAESVLVDSFD